MNSKGQITIPQSVRERMGVVVGSRIEFSDAGCDGVGTFDRKALGLPGMLPVG